MTIADSFEAFDVLDTAVAEHYLGYTAADINEALERGLTVEETVVMLQERYKERDAAEVVIVCDDARKAAKTRPTRADEQTD